MTEKQMAIKQSKNDVVERINEIQAARLDWLETLQKPDPDHPDAIVNPDIFDSQGTRYLTAPLTDLINDLHKYVISHDFYPDAYEIVLEIDKMLEVWGRWASEVSTIGDGQYDYATRPDAPTSWAAFERVLMLVPNRTYRRPESIDSLLKETGITYNQIAQIYGWYREDGYPDTDKVKMEIRSPGSQYRPETWTSPEVPKAEKRNRLAWEKRKTQPVNLANFRKQNRANLSRDWAKPGVAPEPIEQLLVMPGMTIEQVAKMKQISIEEVLEHARIMGVAVDHSAAVEMSEEIKYDPRSKGKSLAELQERIDNEKKTGKRESHFQRGDLASQVIAMIQDDPKISTGIILRSVIEQHPHATADIVSEIQKSFNDMMGVFSVKSKEEPTYNPAEHLELLNKPDLMGLAEEYGIEVGHQMKKAEILEKIQFFLLQRDEETEKMAKA